MNNVTKFYPHNAAKDPDAVLEQALGQFSEVLIIGWDKEGMMDARATLGLKDGCEVLWLMESFKHNMMNGEYGGDEE